MPDLLVGLKANYKILIIGGSDKALHMVKRLLKFTRSIFLVSKEIDPRFEKFLNSERIFYHEKKLTKKHLKSANFAILCDDDLYLQKKVIKRAKKLNLPLWWPGHYEESSFFLPQSFRLDDLIIGISSSGVSDALESAIFEQVKDQIDFRVTGLLRRLRSKKEYYNSRVRPHLQEMFWKDIVEYAYSNLNTLNSFEEEAGRLFVKYSKL